MQCVPPSSTPLFRRTSAVRLLERSPPPPASGGAATPSATPPPPPPAPLKRTRRVRKQSDCLSHTFEHRQYRRKKGQRLPLPTLTEIHIGYTHTHTHSMATSPTADRHIGPARSGAGSAGVRRALNKKVTPRDLLSSRWLPLRRRRERGWTNSGSSRQLKADLRLWRALARTDEPGETSVRRRGRRLPEL